ncbi:MAG: hypothetical protein N4A44_01855 [Alphaproteobacteria bacterium]|jgi:amino acid transporter|nr:hypothetical protein [Alphaproteobacteria bacterium]
MNSLLTDGLNNLKRFFIALSLFFLGYLIVFCILCIFSNPETTESAFNQVLPMKEDIKFDFFMTYFLSLTIGTFMSFMAFRGIIFLPGDGSFVINKKAFDLSRIMMLSFAFGAFFHLSIASQYILVLLKNPFH